VNKGGKKSTTASATSPAIVKAATRAREALELRKAGKSFSKIAEALGYGSSNGAYQAVKRELAELTRQPAEELLALEVERLDELFGALWEQARTGDLDAVEGTRKLIMDRAKLLGLVTQKVQVEPPSRDAMWERVRGWLSEPTPELVRVLEECGWKRDRITS